MILERLTPRGGPRQKAVVVARIGVPKPRKHLGARRGRDSHRLVSKSLSACELQMSVALNPRGVLCRAPAVVWSPSAVDPGREQPPCFCPGAVPDPVRGLLTPRLSLLLSAPRSHARSRSPDALNRRSERRSDRSLIARSIRSLDERAADASISAVEIRGEQEGEHRGEQGLARGVPPLAHLARHESRSM